jgi:RNA polymerase sigma-70 factor, ECF subfamily
VTRYALSGDGSGSHLPSEPANRDLLAVRSALVENTGGRSRVRNRAHGDASSRHAPGGNTKPIGGRLTGGNRPLPSQAGTGLLDTDATVILPRIVPPQATPPTGTPTSAPAETPEATDTGTADTGKAEAPAATTGAACEGDVDLAEPDEAYDAAGSPEDSSGDADLTVTELLPAITGSDDVTALLPAVPAGYPDRPDPSDAAAEVWALVEQAQAGDAEAFGRIYDRYVDTVFRFIYFRVGNRQLAEDLTSDTFLRALKRIGSFTWQGRDLGAWLVTIARNLVADHFKSGRYRLEVTAGDVLDADREDRGPEGSPESAVVDHITNVALLTAVKRLNPEQQECIVLRFLQGFSVAETAQAMGKNEGAIKALQYRAVRALARLLPDGFQA